MAEDLNRLAASLEYYFDRLWPILRSITGKGVRQTHDILGEILPLVRHEIPSGSQVLDWRVPKEWVVREAYVIDPRGRRILDIRDNNLHLVNYSVAFRGNLSLAELQGHLHSLPYKPDAIPYVTSYYSPYWGFCLSHRQREQLVEGEYQVVVDTDHIDGSLTLSDAVLPGRSRQEILLSSYTCHPSLAVNELSGPLVCAFLYRELATLEERYYTYRFVLAPETIGSICYLHRHGEHLKRHLAAGFVITCNGHDAPFTYQRSRAGNSLADRATEYVLRKRHPGFHRLRDFRPTGSDERQYCSPGFNLPVGSLMRTPYAEYPEYHTSLDNKAIVSFKAMAQSVKTYTEICRVLEMNRRYLNLQPHGEPQLGKRGLYPSLGTQSHVERRIEALLWLLNYSDGEHDLLDIAERSGLDIGELHQAARDCLAKGLIRELT